MQYYAKMSNYTKFALKGVITISAFSLLAACLGYLVRLLLAKNLSLEEFGLFYAVFSFLGLLGIFKTLGFDRSLIKFIPEFKHEGRNNFIKSSIIYVSIIQLITNTIIIFGVYLLSNYLSVNFFHSEQASSILKLMAIAFFIDSFVFVLKFAFQGFQNMMLFSGIDFIRMVLLLTITFIGFKLNYNILSPVIAYIVVPFILLLVFVPILLKKIFPEFAASNVIFSKSLFKRIFRYSIFVVATSSGALILGYTDSIMLTYFSGLKNVGLYNIALPTARWLTFFPMSIMGIMIPLASELWVKKKTALLKEGIELLYKYSAIFIMPLAIIMFSFAELLIGTLFGSQYVSASNAMRILVFGMIFTTFYIINNSFFSGIGKPEINSKAVYIAAIFNIISNLILIPLIGIIGAAITNSVGYVIMTVFGFTKIKDFVDITFPVKSWVKTFFAGFIFVSTIWLLKKILVLNVWLEAAVVLGAAGIVYIALLFLLRIIDVKELKMLYKRVML